MNILKVFVFFWYINCNQPMMRYKMINLDAFTDLPEETKNKILTLSKNDDSAYEAQIKNLTKQAKAYSDYDDIKAKLNESSNEKLQFETKIKEMKKEYALDKQLLSANLGNEKLVRKLLDTSSLNYDETTGTFTDLADKVKVICEEYGIDSTKVEGTAKPTPTITSTPSPTTVKKEAPTEETNIALSIAERLGEARFKKTSAQLASAQERLSSQKISMPRFIQQPVPINVPVNSPSVPPVNSPSVPVNAPNAPAPSKGKGASTGEK
jgi:hypothetical protein